MDRGWKLNQIHLDGKKPEIVVPERLISHRPDYDRPLPTAEPAFGKFRITVRFLGKVSPGNIRYGLSGRAVVPACFSRREGRRLCDRRLPDPSGVEVILRGQTEVFGLCGAR